MMIKIQALKCLRRVLIKMEKNDIYATVLMLFLGLVIILGIYYIVNNEMSKNNYKQQEIGYQLGQVEMSKTIVNTLASCQTIKGYTTYGTNITLVAYECIKQGN